LLLTLMELTFYILTSGALDSVHLLTLPSALNLILQISLDKRNFMATL